MRYLADGVDSEVIYGGIGLGLGPTPVDGTLTDVDRPHHRDRQGGKLQGKLPETPLSGE